MIKPAAVMLATFALSASSSAARSLAQEDGAAPDMADDMMGPMDDTAEGPMQEDMSEEMPEEMPADNMDDTDMGPTEADDMDASPTMADDMEMGPTEADDMEMGPTEADDMDASEATAIDPSTIPTGADGCLTAAANALATPELSTLVDLVNNAGLLPDLSDPGRSLTILAPNNAAFEAAELPTDEPSVLALLQGHIVRGSFLAGELNNNIQLRTVMDDFIVVKNTGGPISFTAPFNGTVATAVTPDIASCNATVHIIDTVLIPGMAPDRKSVV